MQAVENVKQKGAVRDTKVQTPAYEEEKNSERSSFEVWREQLRLRKFRTIKKIRND